MPSGRAPAAPWTRPRMVDRLPFLEPTPGLCTGRGFSLSLARHGGAMVGMQTARPGLGLSTVAVRTTAAAGSWCAGCPVSGTMARAVRCSSSCAIGTPACRRLKVVQCTGRVQSSQQLCNYACVQCVLVSSAHHGGNKLNFRARHSASSSSRSKFMLQFESYL